MNCKYTLPCLLFVLTLLPGIAAPLPTPEEKRWAVLGPTSLIQLIATPISFDGKVVAVEGYLSTGYEDTRLYLTKDDADYCNGANAVLVTFADKLVLRPDNPKHSLSPFDHQRVFLIGRFHAKDKELADIVQVVLARRFYDGTKILNPPETKEKGSH